MSFAGHVAAHGLALKDLTISLTNGRDYKVTKGSVFLTSPSVAHTAALMGLVRAVAWSTDQAAKVEGDRALFERHRDQFFNVPYDGALLAVKIEVFKAPPPSIIINVADERPEPSLPTPRTGFEYK